MNFLSYIVVEISLTKDVERERRTYTRKNKWENAGVKSHDVTSHCQLTYKILIFYLEQLLRNLLRKITVLIAWRERKDNKYKEEQIGQSRVSFPRSDWIIIWGKH